MSAQNKLKLNKINIESIVFDFGITKEIIITFPSSAVFRVQVHETGKPKPSVMVELGYVKEKLDNTLFNLSELSDSYYISTDILVVSVRKSDAKIQCFDKADNKFIVSIDLNRAFSKKSSTLNFSMSDNESFYGLGFQRKTFNARGHKLTFRKEYRWNEATVPYFLSTAGYGFFSANTYDHEFDFTGEKSHSISTSGGNIDFFIFYGPSFKDIIDSYTKLTGRPEVVPKWALGLCYVARLFESQTGLLEIAERFREEGIPCDMLGLEPGWEKYYYQMKWIWNDELFPAPKEMIEKLHKMGFAFELWESGDAPTAGYMNPENRRNWFAERIKTSLDIGVDFFKQDDPYPRCITSEEMVTDPAVEVFLEDDGQYTEAETRNIANTLYSSTVFDEFKRLTDKRTMIIFHSYGATISSQKYPLAWAGDFKLGNGALNASLSGHSMVTQDMRSETPSGIHFGFFIPFPFMDSWAYYLEPWLFSDFLKEIICFYSRLRSSLFPYLYNAQIQSHTKGLPMLRPMVLEFQNDSKTHNIDNQFMLGDSFLVGTNENRNSLIYLPEGEWVDYWTREIIISKGEFFSSTWPSYAGGSLYVKSGSMIPMNTASDSILLADNSLLIIDIYPGERSIMDLYEDDGVTLEYNSGKFSKTLIECISSAGLIELKTEAPAGSYSGMPDQRVYLFKVHMQSIPEKILFGDFVLENFPGLEKLLTEYNNGWYYESKTSSLFIKPDNCWKLNNMPEDMVSFYGCKICCKSSILPQKIITIKIAAESELKLKKNSVKDNSAIQSGNGSFKAIINPPERVKLNHGDNWLPYYAYVSFEIIYNRQRLTSASPEVTMQVLNNKNGDILQEFKTNAFEGTGFFPKIIIGSPKEPPDVWIKLAAYGVNTELIHYKINGNN